jgi:hydrogenase nickel incorporation protein HypB
MCRTCGCDGGETRIDDGGHGAARPRPDQLPHLPDHQHEHAHGQPSPAPDTPAGPSGQGGFAGPVGARVAVEVEILARNDEQAARNRARFAAAGTAAVNLMSSPGSGKTTLLERTIPALAGEIGCAVVEGDQETPLDADRIRATGAPAVQISTGTGCHLDAGMLARAVDALGLAATDAALDAALDADDSPARSGPAGGRPAPRLLFVENVGNLVCPALFDLGEQARVVITSVTEGEDKPLKYPHMFAAADLVVLTKTDLLPHLGYDPAAFRAAVRRTNPAAPVLALSATTGEGMADWLTWLRATVSS